MNTLVVGLGSMGKRRIRLLKQYDTKMQIYGIDLQIERCNNITEEFGIETGTDLETIVTKYNMDCVFITTSPSSHAVIVSKCLELGLHVFTELNLLSTCYEENINLAKDRELVLFQSSTLLYRKEIQYIKQRINNYDGLLRYEYHVGQYLPDWHPWEDYRNFFVADKTTNGCREIMAIDLPWLVDTFGKIIDVSVNKSKISSLEISYPDYFTIYIKHETGHEGVFIVDLVSRNAQRNLQVIGENLFITWDGSPFGLKEMNLDLNNLKTIELYDRIDKQNDYSANIIEDAYYFEIEDFFKTIEDREHTPKYSYEKDKELLKIIDNIER